MGAAGDVTPAVPGWGPVRVARSADPRCAIQRSAPISQAVATNRVCRRPRSTA